MSTEWLSQHFDFSTMGPSDMILARHVEILRADAEAPTLATIFGSTSQILYCPLGANLSMINAPCLYATHGLDSRRPSPGLFVDTTIVRDVIRFETWNPEDVAAVWTAGIGSLVHKIRRVVTANPHLTFTPTEAQVPGWAGGPLGLTRHVETLDVRLESLPSPDDSLSTTYDLVIEFQYQSEVSKDTGRIWSLSTNGI